MEIQESRRNEEASWQNVPSRIMTLCFSSTIVPQLGMGLAIELFWKQCLCLHISSSFLKNAWCQPNIQGFHLAILGGRCRTNLFFSNSFAHLDTTLDTDNLISIQHFSAIPYLCKTEQTSLRGDLDHWESQTCRCSGIGSSLHANTKQLSAHQNFIRLLSDRSFCLWI